MAQDPISLLTKKCTGCGETKPAVLEFFSRKRSTKDGLRSYCRPCGAAYTLAYRQKHPAHMPAYRNTNREKIKKARVAQRKAKRDSIAAYNVKWRARNPEYHRQWNDDNRAKRRQYTNKSHRWRRATDPRFKLSRNISNLIRHSLLTGKRGRHWETLVNYSLSQLVLHIERQFTRGMTWENYGGWQIDHIVPVVHFKFETPKDSDFKACWALTNLRSLWARLNMSKGGRRQHLL